MSEFIKKTDTVRFGVTTHNPSGGALKTADEAPRWRVFEEASDTSILDGLFTVRTGYDGTYRGTFDATIVNGFSSNSYYEIHASGKVDGIVGRAIIKTFVLDDIYNANMVEISGSKLAGTYVDANVQLISDDATAASNLELQYDGTGLTGATFPSNQADLDTAQADLDIVTGADGVNLLSGTQTSIDAIETDTGTTIPATITTAQNDLDIITGADGANLLSATQTQVNDILTDTGTTIPGTITTLQSDTDDIQTRLPAALVGGLMSSDVTAISTDTTAANNLELQYDGTGLTGATFPSNQADLDTAQNDLDIITDSDGVVVGDAGVDKVWDEATAGHVSADTFGAALQPVYYANIKYVKDAGNASDEYAACWYKDATPVESGSLTNPAISVYNTNGGASLFTNQTMDYASTALGVVRYDSTLLTPSGEPFVVHVSGVIDSVSRTWKQIVGLDDIF
jgi:hypothetical protein